eukprot:gi/632981294/ref/XP_007907512.1/ PREDICTED: rho GTPase-activating protein 9 isoform X2 [Callorhinchus milii]
MFTGSGGRLGQQPVPQGTVLLQALYYYQYIATDGRLIQISEGDQFVLLQKSNEDWWQVRRQGEPKKVKPIYVPAKYVLEVPPGTTGSLRATPAECTSKSGVEFSGTWPAPSSAAALKYTMSSRNTGPQLAHCLWEGNHARTVSSSINRIESSRGRGIHLLRPNPHEKVGRNGSSVTERNFASIRVAKPESRVQESPVTTESVVELAGRSDSPVYTNLEELRMVHLEPPNPINPPVQVLDLWERHVDPATDRNFYFNTVTKEKTWKPPRRARNRMARSHTPPPDCSTVQRVPGSSSSYNHFMQPLVDKKNGDALQKRDSPVRDSLSLPRAASTEMLGTAEHGSSKVRLRNRNDGLLNKRFSLGKSMIITDNLDPKVTHWRNLSHHSFCVSMNDPAAGASPMLEKAGLLNKTKIAEGGRKLKKNWSISRVVLVGNSLAFYKETKTQTAASWKPGNRPESSVDLRGSLIEWTKEMSSKKNVFRLRTVTGNEFLFQAENEDYISDWYKTIKNVIETLDRENPLDYQMVYALRRSSSAELLDCSGDEDENPAKEKRDSRMTLLRRMNSDSSEKKRVKSRLRKFITKRPPLQSLQEKGLIKDQVFGCRLETLCDREKENVPKFVQLCIDAVEKRGLEADGIYRVSGNLATIQKLRFLVDHEEKLNMDDAQWEDVHVITGALKMFFRELPEPLVPYNSFEHFVSAIKIADAAEKVESIKQLVWSLPKPNQDTMRVMFRHLKKVVEHSEANRMTAQSIAIVFGPTLMRSEKDFSNMAVHMVYQNQIVELILVECDGIFNPENKLLR